MPRQVHNPGDLLPLYWTATAVRLTRLALLDYARKCLSRARREGNADVKRLYLHMAAQHQSLAEELRVAYDTVESMEDDDTIRPGIIGVGLESGRAAEHARDLEEIKRRDYGRRDP